MANYQFKTVPNQKVVKVSKEECDKNHKYATINLDAMEKAARDLDAGAFKLWCYFSKNQNDYEFALSQKAVEENFGMKKKQYDNAVAQLIEKNYLVVSKGNHYIFNEVAVVPKSDNALYQKDTTALYQKDTTGSTKKIQEILQTNTINNTESAAELPPPSGFAAQKKKSLEELRLDVQLAMDKANGIKEEFVF